MNLKTIYTLLFIFSNLANAGNWNSTYYFSPGIQISWDFHASFLFGIKISFGKMVSEEYYYNLTIGRDSILGKNRQHVKSAHLYCEIQGGSFGSYYPLSAGAGMGAAIFTGDNDYKIHPKFSLFGGAGIFITLDYIYGKNLTALGLQSVLPVAFKKSYRNLRQ